MEFSKDLLMLALYLSWQSTDPEQLSRWSTSNLSSKHYDIRFAAERGTLAANERHYWTLRLSSFCRRQKRLLA
jgi:hypothetical protein